MNHLSEDDLILYYYRESADDGPIEVHLASCDSCRAHYHKLQRVLSAVDMFSVPERSGRYGSEVWKRLEQVLPARRRSRWKLKVQWPRPALAGAIAALVFIAFILGHYWPRPESHTMATSVLENAGNRVLIASVADHLDRSRIVLIEIMHARQETGQIDISTDQERAAELTAANRLFRQTAQQNGESGLASVLEDLERILLELEHSPSQVPAEDLDSIRQRIETQGLLFKVRILENQMRERQKARARELAQRSS